MEIQALINEYKVSASEQVKGQIVDQMLPLVKSIVGKINRPSNSLTDFEDLFDIGVMGLLEALESFDANKGIQFNTFAYYRIRGSIIDYLRSIDELPRTKRTAYGKAQDAINRLQQLYGRTPSNQEVADELDMSLTDYEQLLGIVQQRAALSLDAGSDQDDLTPVSFSLEDDTFSAPDSNLIAKETSTFLQAAIESLPKREQIILMLYYYEEYTLKEIASVVNLSEARISQIIGKILMDLRSRLSHAVAA